MARSVRDSKLETRTARLKLRIGRRFWKGIGKGVAIGYRRTLEGYGCWQVRRFDRSGSYTFSTLGKADDHQNANGIDVLDFFQAQTRARQWSDTTVRAQKGIGAPLTVEAAAARYLDWYRENRKAAKATEHTVQAHIIPAFGGCLVSEVSYLEIRGWHEKLAVTPGRLRTGLGATQNYAGKPRGEEEKRARKATANRILTVLKAILNKAWRDGLVPDDSAWRRVKPFERADEPVVRFLSEAEAVRLMNACKLDFRNLVKAALFTGARYGELVQLRVSDVNIETAQVLIRPSKSGKKRHVPLNGKGAAFFGEMIAGRTGDSVVFLRHDGEPWGKSHQARLMIEACKVAKIQPAIGFHELRHTYASLLAQSGADLLTISKLLGHADTRITSRHYAHLCDTTLRNAVVSHLPGFSHVAERRVVSIN
jgi:integrase